MTDAAVLGVCIFIGLMFGALQIASAIEKAASSIDALARRFGEIQVTLAEIRLVMEEDHILHASNPKDAL